MIILIYDYEYIQNRVVLTIAMKVVDKTKRQPETNRIALLSL